MPLQTIYIVRHGYRSSWSTNFETGAITSTVPPPTGVPSDLPLTAYGAHQALQLASVAPILDPPVRRIYSSAFYRCLQTVAPFAARCGGDVPVFCDRGLGEWFGTAPFPHPAPAPLPVLQHFFPSLAERTSIIPAPHGESLPQLHDRCAYALAALIADCDAAFTSVEPAAVLVCTHAAAMIAMGRALTGRMPADVGERDFHAYTCGLSRFERVGTLAGGGVTGWVAGEKVLDVGWRGGKGVGGGWKCVVDAGTEHLEGGGERDWHFSGDESFIEDTGKFEVEVAAGDSAPAMRDGESVRDTDSKTSKL